MRDVEQLIRLASDERVIAAEDAARLRTHVSRKGGDVESVLGVMVRFHGVSAEAADGLRARMKEAPAAATAPSGRAIGKRAGVAAPAQEPPTATQEHDGGDVDGATAGREAEPPRRASARVAPVASVPGAVMCETCKAPRPVTAAGRCGVCGRTLGAAQASGMSPLRVVFPVLSLVGFGLGIGIYASFRTILPAIPFLLAGAFFASAKVREVAGLVQRFSPFY